jgi:signal transduction histidine kinase
MEPRLMELALSNLLANALRYARRNVRIEVAREKGLCRLVVEDDGEGMTDDQIVKLGKRGVRLDERTEGHGMGIAIAFEILRLNRGGMEMGRSGLGGLAVKMSFVAKGRAPHEGAPNHQA